MCRNISNLEKLNWLYSFLQKLETNPVVYSEDLFLAKEYTNDIIELWKDDYK
jgi:hypothetical protein